MCYNSSCLAVSRDLENHSIVDFPLPLTTLPLLADPKFQPEYPGLGSPAICASGSCHVEPSSFYYVQIEKAFRSHVNCYVISKAYSDVRTKKLTLNNKI